MVEVVAFLAAGATVAIVMLLRRSWRRRPNRLRASLLLGFVSLVLLFQPPDAASAFLAAGVMCNTAVVMRNRGRMPVVGRSLRSRDDGSIWVAADPTVHRWLALADRRAWLGASIGDVFIAIGMFLAVVTR
jgi:hypothetical protein